MGGYSEAKCKFCGEKIFWNNSSHYVDNDGEWHNRRRPVNPGGGEHHCAKKSEWIQARQATLLAVGV